eukprot:TRINITY_DN112740_c0_g1_i1.p1 TRINITY_DN112740_c0_g1~~TRINITY_DN112740_c0_g1_i1.p1  ORF type:complete len:263 (+),score=38.09 TRINITY_DN112740_c0_g1_i1:109-897(+)
MAGNQGNDQILGNQGNSSEDIMSTEDKQVSVIFKQFDRDGDGSISRGELALLLKRLDPGTFSEEAVDDLMRAVDRNGDGQIDVSEFWEYLRQDPGAMSTLEGYLNQDLEEGPILGVWQRVGPFQVRLTNWHINRWEAKCDGEYEILCCEDDDLERVTARHAIGQQHTAVVHKKAKGCHYYKAGNYAYVVFYPGFPQGGEGNADVHAPWGTVFRDIPRNGSAMLRAPLSFIAQQDLEKEARAGHVQFVGPFKVMLESLEPSRR